jgi:putative transposase
MPRKPRFLLSQTYYHIINRGNNRDIIFKENDDYLYFLELITRHKKEHQFNLFHYCLMPNHFHFLIQTGDATGFSVFIKKISLSFYYYFKKKYNLVGHLWQNRYKSQPVGKDEYFIQCGKYIELNPVRADIVNHPKNYAYSSYKYYAEGKEDNLITENFFYKRLGKEREERQKNYQKMVINEMINGSYGKSVWGSDEQRYREKRKINRKIKTS